MSSHPPPSPSSQPQQQEQTQGGTIYSSGSGSGGGIGTGGPGSSTQFGDTTLTKVFVGGLAWETTREGLRHHFQQFGDILEAVVITDKATGRSKGYGFVTFRDPEGARRACADPTPVIDGRRANCNLASLGVRSRPGTPQGGRFRGGSPSPGRSPGRAQPFNAAASSPQHLPFPYQQAYHYPPYGYSPYQQEFLYPPNMVYNGPFYMTPPFPPALFGGGAGGGGGGGPPPPGLGSPSSSSAAGGGGIYASYTPFSPHQHYQHVPFPYLPFGSSHVPPHNLPSPSGLTPDQSPPATAGGGPQPQHGVASHQLHQHPASSTQ